MFRVAVIYDFDISSHAQSMSHTKLAIAEKKQTHEILLSNITPIRGS